MLCDDHTTRPMENCEVLTKYVLNDAIRLMGPADAPLPPPPVHEIPWPSVQVRTHRRKRVNKKWRKRYGLRPDVSVDTGQVYEVRGIPSCLAAPSRTLAAYPHTYKKIITAMEKRYGTRTNSRSQHPLYPA